MVTQKSSASFNSIVVCKEMSVNYCNKSFINMTKIILLAVFFTGAAMAHPASMCSLASTVAVASTQRQFMISAVLRRHGDGMTIKLLHTFRKAQSSDEALGKFTRDVLDEYPGYGILSTLISEVTADEKAKVCGLKT